MDQDTCCSSKTEHPSHRKHLTRLNRAAGQLDGVRKMIEEQRYCPEILTQLRAVHSALKALEIEILKTHLNSCVINALSSTDDKKREAQIEELSGILQKFG